MRNGTGVASAPSVQPALAQVTGGVYGWLLGLLHEAAVDWWNELVEHRASDLDGIRRAAYAIERRREDERIARQNRRPRGHVACGR